MKKMCKALDSKSGSRNFPECLVLEEGAKHHQAETKNMQGEFSHRVMKSHKKLDLMLPHAALSNINGISVLEEFTVSS